MRTLDSDQKEIEKSYYVKMQETFSSQMTIFIGFNNCYRLIYADYNLQTNSIDVTTFENYILRIDCNKAEDGLSTTPCSQNSLNALAIDNPFEYARLALDGEMQAWVDAIDSLEV